MKPKTMILMGLAITCGLGASYMTSQLLADRRVAEEPKVSILVAKRHLSIGETIRKPEEFFERKEFTAGQEPKDALRYDEKEVEALKGKMMKSSLRKNDHVTPNDVTGEGGLQIPEGYYAMGFPVNMVTGAAGFATLPLSRVDILLTIKRNDDKSSKAKVLLRNILVLAADSDPNRDNRGLAAPASVVTFALKPDEALKMRMAQEMGQISLALRKQGDKTVLETDDISGEVIYSGDEKKNHDKLAASDPPPLTAKPAPTVLPQVATKPTQPQQAPATPTAEPKTEYQVLDIYNGRQINRHRVVLNGSDPGAENEPAPPKKKGQKKSEDF